MEEARWITENVRYYLRGAKRDYGFLTEEIIKKYITDMMYGTVGD